jgi:hypothetical protein
VNAYAASKRYAAPFLFVFALASLAPAPTYAAKSVCSLLASGPVSGDIQCGVSLRRFGPGAPWILQIDVGKGGLSGVVSIFFDELPAAGTYPSGKIGVVDGGINHGTTTYSVKAGWKIEEVKSVTKVDWGKAELELVSATAEKGALRGRAQGRLRAVLPPTSLGATGPPLEIDVAFDGG